MGGEFLELGRDLDEIAMSTDTRSIKERVGDWIKRRIKAKPLEFTTPEFQNLLNEPLEK